MQLVKCPHCAAFHAEFNAKCPACGAENMRSAQWSEEAIKEFESGRSPPRGISRSAPAPAPDICIQKQLKYHVLAREAAQRGLKLGAEGKRKEATRAAVEAEHYYRLYVEHGGRGPLT